MPIKLPSKKSLLGLGGFALAAALLYWVFSGTSLTQIQSLFMQIDWRLVCAFLFFSLTTSLCRTWRYLLLLKAAGVHISSVALYLVVLVRNALSDLLPAQLGSLVYIALLNKKLGVKLSAASSSFALAILLDLCALVPIIALALFLTNDQLLLSPARSWTAILLISLVCFLIWLLLPGALSMLTKLLEKHLKNSKASALLSFLNEAQQNLTTFQNKALFARLLTLSILLRLGKYVSLYLLLAAMLLPQGISWANLNPGSSILAICSAEFAANLNLSSTLAVGTYQSAWALSFSALGLPSDLAKASAVAHHLFTQIYGYLLAGLAFCLLIVVYKSKKKSETINAVSESELLFSIKIVLLLTAWLSALALVSKFVSA